MVDVIHLSDTHLHEIKPLLNGQEADIIIHSGDLLNRGDYEDYLTGFRQLRAIRGSCDELVFIPGNHDRIFEKSIYNKNEPGGWEDDFEDNKITLLIDKLVTFKKFKVNIYGSPWVPPINGRWAFEASLGKQESKFDKIEFPDNGFTNILVTHSPPYMILDEAWEHFGSVPLRDKVFEVKPDYHLMGHIHSANGQMEFNGIKFYNSSICDESYKPTNPINRFEF